MYSCFYVVESVILFDFIRLVRENSLVFHGSWSSTAELKLPTNLSPSVQIRKYKKYFFDFIFFGCLKSTLDRLLWRQPPVSEKSVMNSNNNSVNLIIGSRKKGSCTRKLNRRTLCNTWNRDSLRLFHCGTDKLGPVEKPLKMHILSLDNNTMCPLKNGETIVRLMIVLLLARMQFSV